jgi:hypothetical protein
MVEATGLPTESFCLACFNNDYPTPTPADFESRRNAPRHVDRSADLMGLDAGLRGAILPPV